MERESDLIGIGTLLPGAHRKLHVWPPETLAPGVILQRRAHMVRDPKTQEVRERATYLEPLVLDYTQFYANLALHNYRPEDEGLCPTCKGAGVVRHGDLVPGQFGFGMTATCPRWRSDAKRCVGDERR